MTCEICAAHEFGSGRLRATFRRTGGGLSPSPGTRRKRLHAPVVHRRQAGVHAAHRRMNWIGATATSHAAGRPPGAAHRSHLGPGVHLLDRGLRSSPPLVLVGPRRARRPVTAAAGRSDVGLVPQLEHVHLREHRPSARGANELRNSGRAIARAKAANSGRKKKPWGPVSTAPPGPWCRTPPPPKRGAPSRGRGRASSVGGPYSTARSPWLESRSVGGQHGA